jgi:hypothetical protein
MSQQALHRRFELRHWKSSALDLCRKSNRIESQISSKVFVEVDPSVIRSCLHLVDFQCIKLFAERQLQVFIELVLERPNSNRMGRDPTALLENSGP